MAAGAHRASCAVVLVPSRDAALPADSELRECPIPAVLILPSPDRDLRFRLAGPRAPRCQLVCIPCFRPDRMGPMDVLLDRDPRPPGHRGALEHGRRDQEREFHQTILVLGLPGRDRRLPVGYLANMLVVPVAENNATYG